MGFKKDLVHRHKVNGTDGLEPTSKSGIPSIVEKKCDPRIQDREPFSAKIRKNWKILEKMRKFMKI